jgi:hypothetical protein
MFDFIPLEYYTPVFYNLLLVIVIGTFIRLQAVSRSGLQTVAGTGTGVFLLFVLVALYIGSRPISGYFFGDMGTYAHRFNLLASGEVPDVGTDLLFELYMKFCSSIMSVKAWFLLDAFIYIGCLYWACRRVFPGQVYISFLMCITAFSFWGYAVNGIRNGMATSLIVLAFSFLGQKWKVAGLCLLAIGVHKSVMLPVFAGIMTYLYKNTRVYLYGWLACVFLSVLSGGFFEHFFSNLGLIKDERFASYLTSTEYSDSFSSTGFRWDFWIYSLVPIVLGWYVVIKRKLHDKLYLLLLNTYTISNAFWILVIQASFSNRFAYLSWFLYPIVLIYPVLKFKICPKQYSKIGLIVLLHFLFTYILWIMN